MMGRTRGVPTAALMHSLKMLATTVGAALLVWGLLLAFASSPAWAATITVNSLADTAADDDGECTLREAITAANTDMASGAATGECAEGSGDDTINFAIPADAGCDATGVCTIAPEGSDLPDITEPVIIDGYTQDGASPNTLATGNDARLKVELSGAAAGAGANGLRILASNSVVRGLVINGWSNEGVEINGIDGPGVSGNRVEGNFIGTDVTGEEDEEALGNVNGVRLVDNASDNVVGGTSAAARNVISGNDSDGVVLGSGASDRVQGNYIGTDASGQEDRGNAENGVRIVSASNSVVGGTSAASANTIAHNGGDGVLIEKFDSPFAGEATGNSVLRNSIFDNGELGIDLAGGDEDLSGVTANDPQDPDTGPNLLQNYPVLTSAATPDGQSVTVRGTLNSTPMDAFNIRFFSSPQADPSGFGEGETYLGQTNLTTNARGNAAFSFSPPTPP